MKIPFTNIDVEYDEIRINAVSCFWGPRNRFLVFRNKFDEIEKLLQSSGPGIRTSYTAVTYYKDGTEVAYTTTMLSTSDFEKLGGYEILDCTPKQSNNVEEPKKEKQSFLKRLLHLLSWK